MNLTKNIFYCAYYHFISAMVFDAEIWPKTSIENFKGYYRFRDYYFNEE